ncbi:hypothetical protein [Methanobacterium oryzae]|uniref:hypothetical protein n=1 Tax=Methanobacterium oryzae TaxID=69540 RepID=UPI003D23A85A
MKISSLLENYEKYLAMPKNLNHVDLSDISTTPASIIPSIYFLNFSSLPPVFPSEYNARIHLKRILGIYEDSNLPENSIFFPFISEKIGGNEKNKARNLGKIDKRISNLFNKGYEQYGGINTFRYVLGEILSNVDQNSEANRIYIYSEMYSKRRYLDIGILDNGITIPGKYEQSRPEFADKDINPYEFENDCEAIYKAINGISTKEGFKRAMEGISSYEDIYLNDWIGYGLNTSINLITEGLGGSFLIASRGGICHLTKKEKKFIKAEGDNILNGTLVCIRFKRAKLKKDFMDYIVDHNPIKGPF